ncbi:MAG: MFS transporter [Caulobacteraceae bacterium]|nr:MFS transporter [Caulobacteraceae bacterium]
MTTTTQTPLPAVPRTIPARHVAAAVMGNALEFYDFTVYTVFAVDIGEAFFPTQAPFVGLFLSLMTFFIGFVTRPVGALVIGRIGDRHGRKPAMLLSFGLMGLGLVGLAATPPYARIGLAAPILVVAFRLIQGFALGGEVGPATAFLVEAAPPRSRGLYGSWQSASQSVSSLVGGLVGVVLTAQLSHAAVAAYGWRVAFWLGALVLPFGLIIRRSLPETLHGEEPASPVHPDRAVLGAHAKVLGLGVMLIMCFTTSTYVRLFMTTYALTSLHIAAGAAYGASVVNGAAGLVFTLLGGALSDRFGRRPAMMWPLGLYLLVTYPAFFMLVRNHDPITLWTVTGLVSALSSMSTGAALIWLTEGLRKEVRSLGMGAVYAVTVAVFGGATQPLLAWLIHASGEPLAPAYFLMVTTAVGLLAMALLDETAPAKV